MSELQLVEMTLTRRFKYLFFSGEKCRCFDQVYRQEADWCRTRGSCHESSYFVTESVFSVGSVIDFESLWELKKKETY